MARKLRRAGREAKAPGARKPLRGTRPAPRARRAGPAKARPRRRIVAKRAPTIVRPARRPAAKTARKAKAAPRAEVHALHGMEDILIERIIAGGSEPSRGIALQDVLYGFTDGMRHLAYVAGYSLGERASRHHPGISALEKMLMAAGFGKVLYYPSEYSAVVTARRVARGSAGMGSVHVFEAGIIAGYLSAMTGVSLSVRESHCSLNGSDFCQFVASASEDPFQVPVATSDMDAASRLIDSAVSGDGAGMSMPYYVLSILPITKEPLMREAAKLLYAMGGRIARSATVDKPAYIRRLAEYAGASGAEVSSGQKSVKVTLRFSPHSSVSGLVALATALVSGYVGIAYLGKPVVGRPLRKGKAYIVEIESIKPISGA